MKNYIKLLCPIIKNKIKSQNIPFFCTYSVTWKCNLKCKMCNIWKKTNLTEMSLQEIEKVFRQLPHITAIRLTGGEPFLREDLIEIVNIINRCTNVQSTLLNSNGILTDRILYFMQHHKNNNIRLKISLTGFADTHDENTGLSGAFQKIVKTIESLKSVQGKYKFYLGINHTISDLHSYKDSQKIRAMCKRYKLSYLPLVAYGQVPLYSDNNDTHIKDPQQEEYINVAKQDLKTILEDLISAAYAIDNSIERFSKIYYLKGLYSRLILNKNISNPKCVILKNHIRLLPNGDIPVCLYNSKIAGNMVRENLKDLWNKPETVKMRNWVDNCKGCWLQCDIFPNLVYSGNVIKYFILYGLTKRIKEL